MSSRDQERLKYMLAVSAATGKCVYLRLDETPAGSVSAGDAKNSAQSKVRRLSGPLRMQHAARLRQPTGYC